jgi:hypothetical protein
MAVARGRSDNGPALAHHGKITRSLPGYNGESRDLLITID